MKTVLGLFQIHVDMIGIAVTDGVGGCFLDDLEDEGTISFILRQPAIDCQFNIDEA